MLRKYKRNSINKIKSPRVAFSHSENFKDSSRSFSDYLDFIKYKSISELNSIIETSSRNSQRFFSSKSTPNSSYNRKIANKSTNSEGIIGTAEDINNKFDKSNFHTTELYDFYKAKNASDSDVIFDKSIKEEDLKRV